MICIPIIANNTDKALEKIARANSLADMLEIRLDLMDTYDLAEIIRAAGRPVLATYRSKREGGRDSLEAEICTQHILAALHAGADIVKIVTRANTWKDNLRVLKLIPRANERNVKIIAFYMGSVGRISRVYSHLIGGYLTFASLEVG